MVQVLGRAGTMLKRKGLPYYPATRGQAKTVGGDATEQAALGKIALAAPAGVAVLRRKLGPRGERCRRASGVGALLREL